MSKDKSLVEKIRPYQKMYEEVSRRLEAEIQKEFEKRGGDTKTYLPEGWKEKE